MQLILDKKFASKLKGRFGKYDFQVGVIEDKPYRRPLKGEKGKKGVDVLTKYAGTTVRKASRRQSGLTVAQVSKKFREHLGFNYLSRPFSKKSSDLIKFCNEFLKMSFGHSEKKRSENLLQAVVRNPMLKKELGYNSPLTQKIKGFDHKGMDTAQLFKSIKAVCNVRKGFFG